MAALGKTKRKAGFIPLTIIFILFIVFLYGPTATIAILSFQGPEGGLTFPMNGVSLHWFRQLFEEQQVGDFGGSLTRSLPPSPNPRSSHPLSAPFSQSAVRERLIGSISIRIEKTSS